MAGSLLHMWLFCTVDPLAADEITLSPSEMAAVRSAEAERIAAISRAYGTVVAMFDKENEGGGSGVIVSDDGFVLTNHHVVLPLGRSGKAGLTGGRLFDWDLIGTDPGGDIALVRLRPPADATADHIWPSAVIADSASVRVGQWVMAMGNPFVLAKDHSPTVTMGLVSGVQRYQDGGSVYGNCIQVDSAINPGNSGGPLLNLQGEVIGINGRAAFADRGRVNVGVGFAVATEQIKNFLPDLFATKVAQHGTLDAQFAMRGGHVICEAINLDSRLARAGAKLGDRLLSLNSVEIVNPNQLANLVSMLPALWPVHLRFERAGKRFEITVRLAALNYVVPASPESRPQDDSDDPDADEIPASEQASGPQEALSRLSPGSILSHEINRANAERLVKSWRRAFKFDSSRALRSRFKRQDGRSGEEVMTILCGDGRFLVMPSQGGETVLYRGGQFFLVQDDHLSRELTAAEAVTLPWILPVLFEAARVDATLLTTLGTTEIDGGDFVNGQRAYRLRVDANSAIWSGYFWLSVSAEPRLLKVGLDLDGTVTRPATLFSDYDRSGSLRIARRRSWVTGVRSEVKQDWAMVGNELIEIPKLLEEPFP